jgi:hypothetical protein
MTSTRQIIAIGGATTQADVALFPYVVAQARGSRPRVSLQPTTSGDSDAFIVKFHGSFSGLPCEPSHLKFFGRCAQPGEVHSRAGHHPRQRREYQEHAGAVAGVGSRHAAAPRVGGGHGSSWFQRGRHLLVLGGSLRCVVGPSWACCRPQPACRELLPALQQRARATTCLS